MKFALGFATMCLLFICIGLQAYILMILLMEITATGHSGVGSAFGYGASLSFSFPAYFIALSLIYGAKLNISANWVHVCYVGSHLIILALMLAFPGQFI